MKFLAFKHYEKYINSSILPIFNKYENKFEFYIQNNIARIFTLLICYIDEYFKLDTKDKYINSVFSNYHRGSN